MTSPKQHKKTLFILFLIVILMFGFAFALVPIYNSLCKTLGINGKVDLSSATEKNTNINDHRLIEVQFVATNNNSLPWLFYPKTSHIQIHPGETAKIEFYAENQSDHPMIVQAIPNVTPALAAKHIKKTECFCFQKQTLNPHEGMDMPLLFHVDNALPNTIHTITLSYTLFDVTHRSTH